MMENKERERPTKGAKVSYLLWLTARAWVLSQLYFEPYLQSIARRFLGNFTNGRLSTLKLATY
jgi:hypothetical protein